MSSAKEVRELMVEITDYPHIPYWMSVRDAIFMMQSVYAATSEHRLLLVFDERYQLQGVLTLKDLITGIEPRFLRKEETSRYQGLTHPDRTRLAVLVEGAFSEKCKEEAKKPVGEIMTPIRATVDADDSIAKAIFVMLQADVDLIPVMDGGKVAGVLRMGDVFNELTKIVIE